VRLVKVLFFGLLVKPLVLLLLGVNLRGRERLPLSGPAIIAANHNSHLDALVLMSLYPLRLIHKIRPVAAADYFFSRRWLAWLARYCIGIIPIDRSGKAGKSQLFAACHAALDAGDIVILFPEGSRGEPEKFGPLKKGLFYLLEDRPQVPVIPVVMHGLGKALPRGEALLVPFNCDVMVGETLAPAADATELLNSLRQRFQDLLSLCLTRNDGNDEC